ncbi:MAG: hypothetical protein IPH62_18795 [Ignavibacteriae bacterium]|nr:hypothetical protein [Ignavibacteriota bacterium]
MDNFVPNVNVLIDGYKTVADDLGKFSLQIPVGDSLRKLDIFGDDIWTRKKHLYVRSDTSNVVEDVLTLEEFPDSVMTFMNYTSARDATVGEYSMRFINPPTFYIVADTLNNSWNKEFASTLKTFIRGELNDVTKGKLFPEGFLKGVNIEVGLIPPPVRTLNYYIIKTSAEYGNAVALTNPYADLTFNPPSIEYCETIFGMYPEPDMSQIKRLMGHELASGLVYMPFRSNDLQSWYNWGPPIEVSRATDTDKKILRAVFSRDTGWRTYDTDYYRFD